MAHSPAIQTGQYAEVADGVRLHYASCGPRDGRLLLFVHGFPEFWYAWHELLPAFGAPGEGHQPWFAVAPDLRGYNLSDKPRELSDYRPARIAEDLIQLARSLGHERFTLVGHDWGGAVCWLIAQLYPQAIERLVILNAPHPVPFARALAEDPAQQVASAYMNWLRRPRSEEALLADDLDLIEQMLRRGFSPTGRRQWFTPAVREAYRDAWSQPDALKSAINYYRVSPIYPPTPEDRGALKLDLKAADFQVKVPTLVIWGDGDTALLPVVLEGLDACVPDLRIEHLPEATHWLVHEEPERVTALIRSFIEDAPRPAGP